MKFLKKWQLALVVCAVAGIMANVYSRNLSHELDNVAMQDVNSLDRRISMLEQRFYMLESSVNRMQLALSQSSAVSQTRARDQEINQLREELIKLNLRINEVGCGLLKLDERTAVSDRGTRRNSPADPCRSNPTAPLRLTILP